MGSISHDDLPKPWIATPCIPSPALSRAAGCNIWLKLDNLQPSGSFKSRGIGNLMFRAIAASSASATASGTNPSDAKGVHFYCSSGGNAGLACAAAAAMLNSPVTIVIPKIVSAFMIEKVRATGARVVQIGANWGEADRYLREELLAKETEHRGVYVPPFDHPDIWRGHSTLVDELAGQMDGVAEVDGIVCNVGGGGLLCGIMSGLEARADTSLGKAKVLAVETLGAESLYRSVEAGKLVTLPKITSIATSLGAPTVAKECFEWTRRKTPEQLACATVTDGEAAMACVRFLDDSRLMVEVACGATLAVAYNGQLRKRLGAGLSDDEWARKNVVLVVCGGSNVSLDILNKYRETYGEEVGF